MSLREEQCKKVCRILDDVLANRPTERDSLIVATRSAFSALSAQPEIIRCKDCKYARLTNDGSCKYCDIWFPDEAEYMDGDYYCASAERKDDE